MQTQYKVCHACDGEFSGGELFCPVDGRRLFTPAGEGHHPTQPGDPLIGATLGDRYRIVRAIGEGGMGIVYEAVHTMIDKRVAVKVLREDFSRRPDVLARFRQEARSASRIGHMNIVDVSDFGETADGASYLAMEMLDGEDLADTLGRDHALSPMRATGIIFQCCRALAAAHAKGIVHRDLKPENIFLVRKDDHPDFVKIVDFGVAKMSDIEILGGEGRKLTKTGMIFGTPEYMSPEQATGGELDHRVDVYALGVILYEVVTGRVPFEGDNFMEILAKHANDPVPTLAQMNPGTRVSPELEAVIYRALEKAPDNRYQSAAELAGALEHVPEMPSILNRESSLPPAWSLVPPPAPSSRQAPTPPPQASKSRLAWYVGGSSALVLAAVAMVAGRSPATSTQPLPAAVVQASPLANVPTPASPPAASPDVRIVVNTKPAGARVTVSNRGQVCAATPCEFSAARGESLVLTASRGKMTATTRLAPEELTSVHLALHPRRPSQATGPTATRRKASGDLKIPAVFR